MTGSRVRWLSPRECRNAQTAARPMPKAAIEPRGSTMSSKPQNTNGMAAATASPIVKWLPEFDVATLNIDPITRAAEPIRM